MRYKWRLIRCFAGSFAKYDTLDTNEMTDWEAYLSNRILIDPALHWVR